MSLYSPDGNDPWVQGAVKIVRDKLCTKFNNEYRKFLMNDLKETSDFPFSDNDADDLCEKFEKVRGTRNVWCFIYKKIYIFPENLSPQGFHI